MLSPQNHAAGFSSSDVALCTTLKRSPERGEESVHGNNPLSGIGTNYIVVTIRR
jgi:hypothetical protein